LIDHSYKNPGDKLSFDSIQKAVSTFNYPVLFLGNSILEKGIDNVQVSNIIKMRSYLIGVGASASAWWYLVIKNVICQISVKPKVLIMIFRDTELTRASFRVKNEHKDRIDLASTGSEPVLDRKAYLNDISNVEYFILKYWPMYQKKNDFHEKFNEGIKNNVASIFYNLPTGIADTLINQVFETSNLDKDLMTQYQLKYEQPGDEEDFDFNNKVEMSFLPDYIELTKKNNIKLILVRAKTRRDVIPNSEPSELVTYIKDLTQYLAANNVPFIDFSHHPEITNEHFADGDHLNDSIGKRKFSELTGEALKPYLEEFQKDSIFIVPNVQKSY
jgi:hypothetical protein